MSIEVVPRKTQNGTVFTALIEEPYPHFDPSLPQGPGNLKYLPVDLTLAVGNANKIEFKRPNKSTFTKPADVDGTPTLGRLQYVNFPAESSVFDMSGLWAFRGVAVFSDGSSFPGSWFEQRVGK